MLERPKNKTKKISNYGTGEISYDWQSMGEKIRLLNQECSLQESQQNSFKFKLIEDPRQSLFNFRKCVVLEKLLLLLTVFYFFLCFIRTQIQSLQIPLNNPVEDRKLIILMNITTIILLSLVFLRLVYINQLHLDQKKFYLIRYQTGFMDDVIRFTKNRSNVFYLFLQIVLIAPHPTLFTERMKFDIYQAFDDIYLSYDVNDFLKLISLLRIYIIFRALINVTDYSSPRAVRLCSYNRINHNFLYTVKCLIKQSPLVSIFVVFFTQVIILSYGMRISEGNIYKENINIGMNGFQSYSNCIWCVFITMATVGYGDYYPKSITGRIIGVLASVNGIILSSLLIVSLSAYLSMDSNQQNSHLILNRLEYQKQLQEQASSVLIETIKLTKQLESSKSNDDDEESNKIKMQFKALKEKIDNVKFKSRQIKSMINNNNIVEQMNRLFEVLKQSLNQIFESQSRLKEKLEEIGRHKHRKNISTYVQKLQKTLIKIQNLE